MEGIHVGVRSALAVGRFRRLAVWPAIPVHLGVEPVADVNERLGEDLERGAVLHLTALAQWSAVVEGIAVELDGRANLAAGRAHLHGFPAQDGFKNSLHGTERRCDVGDGIGHGVRARPEGDGAGDFKSNRVGLHGRLIYADFRPLIEHHFQESRDDVVLGRAPGVMTE